MSMLKNKYFIHNQYLIIQDQRLDLDIRESFDLPTIPWEITQNIGKSPKQGNLIIQEDENDTAQVFFLDQEKKFHGEYREYFRRKILHRCFYNHGKLHGPSEFYAKDSHQIISQGWFVQGLQQGEVKRFYRNGDLYALESYRDGLRDQLQQYLYPGNLLKTSMNYSKGFLHGLVKLYWSNGQLKRISEFNKGLKEGVESIFNEQGVLLDKGNYHQGKPIDAHECYDDQGILRYRKYYHAPERYDISEYDSQGVLTYERVWTSPCEVVDKIFKNNQVQSRFGKLSSKGLQWL